MNQTILEPVLPVVTMVFALTLTACGGSTSADAPDALQLQDQEAQSLVDGDDVNEPVLQCDGQPFDQAEFLFTETDRQWTCTVTSSEFASLDGVYISRDGRANFTRFGDVYWNRNMQTDAINFASPFVQPFVIRDITSANTTLQFNLSDKSGSEQSYDCVLVQREDIS